MAPRIKNPSGAQGDESIFNAEAIRHQKQMRWNPIRTLTPESLARAIEAFDYGDLREFALLADAIAERDDTVKSVKPKREKDVAQLPWQILTLEDSPEAMEHKAALEFFYNNVTAVNAFDRNERGGFSRLVRQMMTAVTFKYAVHHIVWKPDVERTIPLSNGRAIAGLTATLEFCPLSFFENRTGTLRFVEDGLGVEGRPLEEGEWMITVGDGLMSAVAAGFFMKRMCVNDWLNFSELYGLPGRLARTSASKDSEAGRAFKAAAESFGNDFSAIIYGDEGGGKTNTIELIKADGGAGSLPFPPLIERIDRKIAALYRGADLSTMSSKDGEGTGASLQEKEGDILKRDDALTASEAMNHYLDRPVLRHQFGVTQGLAYIQISVPDEEDADKVLARMERLADRGAMISISGAMERFGIPQAAAGDEVFERSRRAAVPADPSIPAINSRPGNPSAREVSVYLKRSRAILGVAFDKALAPIQAAVADLLATPDEEFRAALEAFPAKLVALALSAGADDETAAAFSKVLSGAFFNGVTNHENT